MEGTGTRFEMELELMNCLASPEYLHCETLTIVIHSWTPQTTDHRLIFPHRLFLLIAPHVPYNASHVS